MSTLKAQPLRMLIVEDLEKQILELQNQYLKADATDLTCLVEEITSLNLQKVYTASGVKEEEQNDPVYAAGPSRTSNLDNNQDIDEGLGFDECYDIDDRVKDPSFDYPHKLVI
ncbi:hypothetical protein ACH5RR_033648 [Cinchona calisaya]|uniref:Uncharacterized protein n=1 Tax=Cinchona calisaya TaxID=153742 RepID=A0ABD2YD69_9GENT